MSSSVSSPVRSRGLHREAPACTRRSPTSALWALWGLWGLALMLLATAAPLPAEAGQPTRPTTAAAERSAPTWRRITPMQRNLLSPLETSWNQMPAERRERWLKVADRLEKLPVDERERIRDRMTEWAAMTPLERERARQRFQEANRLSGSGRKAEWEAYTALPEAERRSLVEQGAARTEPMPPAPRPRVSPPAAALGLMGSATPPPGLKPITGTAPAGVVPTNAGGQRQPPQPKIVTQPGAVDRSTLLPRRGPQAASAPAAGTSGATVR